MFYDKYIELCRFKGVSPTAAAMDMGFSKATPTKPNFQNADENADEKAVRVMYPYGSFIILLLLLLARLLRLHRHCYTGQC